MPLVTRTRCRYASRLTQAYFKGLPGPRLFRALRCSQCGNVGNWLGRHYRIKIVPVTPTVSGWRALTDCV